MALIQLLNKLQMKVKDEMNLFFITPYRSSLFKVLVTKFSQGAISFFLEKKS